MKNFKKQQEDKRRKICCLNCKKSMQVKRKNHGDHEMEIGEN